MDAITLQPAAGAHGEITGILLVRACHESQGNPRRKILIPDSAHGTNPATAAIAGYTVENLKSNAKGMVDLDALEPQVTEDAPRSCSPTQPPSASTRATFTHRRNPAPQGRAALYGWRQHERPLRQNSARRQRRGRDAPEPAQDLLHPTRRRRPRLRPGRLQENSRTVLAHPGPSPKTRRHARFRIQPPPVHRPRARLLRQLGMHVRALAYILANGPDGLRQTTEDAVLNANYIREKLEGIYELPYKTQTLARGRFQRPHQQPRASRPATSPSASSTTASTPTRSRSR